jgi:hypothetical protein
LVLEIERNVHLDLILLSEALLVNDVADDARLALRVEDAGNDELVFRKRLFGSNCSGKI